MNRTIDKLNESSYYFNKVQDIIEEFKIDNSPKTMVKLIQEFRFELNSYINSHRATTFTLQAELRTKFGTQFETWYSKKIETLRNHPFSKTLLELRNINQKEGNLYPTFLIKRETENFKILYEFDLVSPENTFIKPYSVTPKNNKATFELPSRQENEDPNKFSSKDEAYLKFQLLKMITNDLKESPKKEIVEIEKIRISRFNSEYSVSDFLEKLREMGKLLECIVLEGKDLLVLP